MPITNRLVLQVSTPPPSQNTDERQKTIFNAMNRSFDQITSILLELAGLSGIVTLQNALDMTKENPV